MFPGDGVAFRTSQRTRDHLAGESIENWKVLRVTLISADVAPIGGCHRKNGQRPPTGRGKPRRGSYIKMAWTIMEVSDLSLPGCYEIPRSFTQVMTFLRVRRSENFRNDGSN